MDRDSIKRNILNVCERVSRAVGSRADKVTVVAATKTVPAEYIAELDGFIRDVGENRVSELIEKREAFSGFNVHFIGTLQRNKVKYVVGNTCLIQSVSSAALADEINRRAAKLGIVQHVLAELNAGDEPSKTGAKSTEIDGLIEYVSALSNVRLDGLMAIPPKDADDDVYKRAVKVFERHVGGDFRILSLGMSGDFERAIGFGSNMVRIGSAIFGKRTG